jgi:hypothetical protein
LAQWRRMSQATRTIASSPWRSPSRGQMTSMTVLRSRRASARLALRVQRATFSSIFSAIVTPPLSTARRRGSYPSCAVAYTLVPPPQSGAVGSQCASHLPHTDVLFNWALTGDTISVSLSATISPNTPLAQTGAAMKWIGTTDPATPIDLTLLRSGCPRGQRLVGGAAGALCEPCSAGKYEDAGRCENCVSPAARTQLARAFSDTGRSADVLPLLESLHAAWRCCLWSRDTPGHVGFAPRPMADLPAFEGR